MNKEDYKKGIIKINKHRCRTCGKISTIVEWKCFNCGKLQKSYENRVGVNYDLKCCLSCNVSIINKKKNLKEKNARHGNRSRKTK